MKTAAFTSTRLSRGLSFTIAATGSLAATWAATPVAQAAPRPAGPVVDPFNAWSVGVGGGYHLFLTPNTTSISGDEYSTDKLFGAGLRGQVEVGRDWHMGNHVFGLYGDVHVGDVSTNHSSDSYSQIRWGTGLDVTARAGHVVAPNTLLYGLAGWQGQHYSADDYSGGTRSGWTHGPTVGVGLETLLAGHSNMTFKAEYRAGLLDSLPGSSQDYGESDSVSSSYGRTHTQSLMFTLSWKTPAH
jgi:hypothetical protein